MGLGPAKITTPYYDKYFNNNYYTLIGDKLGDYGRYKQVTIPQFPYPPIKQCAQSPPQMTQCYPFQHGQMQTSVYPTYR